MIANQQLKPTFARRHSTWMRTAVVAAVVTTAGSRRPMAHIVANGRTANSEVD